MAELVLRTPPPARRPAASPPSRSLAQLIGPLSLFSSLRLWRNLIYPKIRDETW